MLRPGILENNTMALTTQDGNRVWTKSSKSVESDCIEACRTNLILLRDSKDPAGPTLAFNERAWTAFVSAIRD
jgi:hypothetical protein